MTEQPIKTGAARGIHRHPIPEQPKCKTCNGNKIIIKKQGDITHHEPCPDCQPKQPNKNAMIFDQIDGCCDIIEKLLNELVPKTSQVEGCITTHNSWRDHNLKYLRAAFV